MASVSLKTARHGVTVSVRMQNNKCIYEGCVKPAVEGKKFCNTCLIIMESAKIRLNKNKGIVKGRMPKFNHNYGSEVGTYDLVTDMQFEKFRWGRI